MVKRARDFATKGVFAIAAGVVALGGLYMLYSGRKSAAEDARAKIGQVKSVVKKVHTVRDGPAIVHDRISLSLAEEIAKSGERVILPLSDDGINVNALLGASYCDWLRDLEFDPYVTFSETTTVTAL